MRQNAPDSVLIKIFLPADHAPLIWLRLHCLPNWPDQIKFPSDWPENLTLSKCKILDLSELKAFVDHNSNVAQMTEFVFDTVENIVGKGENAGYQHFLLFPQCFKKVSFPKQFKL